MKDQVESLADVRYVKPEVIDLGAAVTIHGGGNCQSGLSAQYDCVEFGTSAGGYCSDFGGSPGIAT